MWVADEYVIVHVTAIRNVRRRALGRTATDNDETSWMHCSWLALIGRLIELSFQPDHACARGRRTPVLLLTVPTGFRPLTFFPHRHIAYNLLPTLSHTPCVTLRFTIREAMAFGIKEPCTHHLVLP